MRNKKVEKWLGKYPWNIALLYSKLMSFHVKPKNFLFLRPLCTIKTFGRNRLEKEKYGVIYSTMNTVNKFNFI